MGRVRQATVPGAHVPLQCGGKRGGKTKQRRGLQCTRRGTTPAREGEGEREREGERESFLPIDPHCSSLSCPVLSSPLSHTRTLVLSAGRPHLAPVLSLLFSLSGSLALCVLTSNGGFFRAFLPPMISSPSSLSVHCHRTMGTCLRSIF